MKGSWNFFAALLAGFALALGITMGAFYLNLGVHSKGSKWAFQINQKKLRLAAQSPSPKLLLVGGSATLFGLSAREMQKQTGWPAVNLGTHAALGTAYILRQGQKAAKPGDVILLTLEYELYWYGKVEQSWADTMLIDYVVSRDPIFFRELTAGEQWRVFMLTSNRRLVRGIKNRSRAESAEPGIDIYDLRYLNGWGDQTDHPQAKLPERRHAGLQVKSSLSYGLPDQPKGFALVRAFCKWAQTNQVRVLATFPNLCDQPEYHGPIAQKAAQRIKELYASLEVPLVGEYTDAILPPDHFFDTIYHLTDEAALARTQRLAGQLRPFLSSPNFAAPVSLVAP